jgi:hypothetical protein
LSGLTQITDFIQRIGADKGSGEKTARNYKGSPTILRFTLAHARGDLPPVSGRTHLPAERAETHGSQDALLTRSENLVAPRKGRACGSIALPPNVAQRGSCCAATMTFETTLVWLVGVGEPVDDVKGHMLIREGIKAGLRVH